MRVLHVIPSFARRDGGPSELLRGLLPALSDIGIEVVLVTTDKGAVSDDYDLIGSVESYVVRSRPPRSLNFAPGMIKVLRRELPRADAVHIHSVNSFPTSVAMLLARRYRVPYLLEPHGAFNRYHMSEGRLKKSIYNLVVDRIGFRHIELLVVSSERERDHARDVVAAESVEMPLGVPEDLYGVERSVRSDDASCILFLGRLARKKRLDLLLKALAREPLMSQRWRLLVAGPKDSDLPYDPKKLAEQLGIADRVEWLGTVGGTRRRELLAKAHVFVAPSDDESFGMAVAEAMAAGCAVVSSYEVGIAREAARAGAVVGVQQDVDEISAAIGKLLADEAARNRLGLKAREYAAERFRWSVAAHIARGAYESVAAGEAAGPRVAFTQPYVPAYRVPLFDAVQRELAEHGGTFEVYAGAPKGAQAVRGDQASASWQRSLTGHSLQIGKREIEFRSLPPDAKAADVVVTELVVGNLVAWWRLLTRKPTVLWGHGAAYITKPSRLGDLLKVCMVRLASHTMTYTEGGRAHLIAQGAPTEKVTAIGNSTDTEILREAIVNLRAGNRRATRKPCALFIGGLDASKRIDFVLEAARYARELDPAFSLVMIGRGALADVVRTQAQMTGGIRVLHEARGRELAELAASADMIWMPGRVGLVAVDAIAVGLPVHTVHHDAHAPEIELLREGEVEFLPDDPAEFARESLNRAGQLPLREDYPTVQQVARGMVDVIRRVARSRRSRR